MKEDAKILRSLLEEIIGNIPDDKETGIMLSGGLDSSVLASIMLSKGRTVRAISSSFKGEELYDETEYVEMVKEKYPQLEINYVTPLDIDLPKELKKLISIIKEPIVTGSFLMQYFIIKRASELGMKRLIYGQWPDELMGGYDSFLVSKAKDDFKHLKISNALLNIKEFICRSKAVKNNLILLRLLKLFLTSKGLKKHLLAGVAPLEHLIDIANKTAAAFGINLILPYGDPKIKEFCQSIHLDRLVYRGQTKIILREAAVGIAPEGILKRRKKFGFPGPDRIWLSRNEDAIRALNDKTVNKEYEKFFKNPKNRWPKGLWIALSNVFLPK
jgi:asparagine synthase (glutamine-hydrolysing)